jgi:hypothetical protein
MSFVFTTPELLAAAAGDVQAIGLAISAGNAAAAGPTTEVVPAAADSVSARTAALFGAHARQYQAVSEHAAAFHHQFTQALKASADSYAATEVVNTARAQPNGSWAHFGVLNSAANNRSFTTPGSAGTDWATTTASSGQPFVATPNVKPAIPSANPAALVSPNTGATSLGSASNANAALAPITLSRNGVALIMGGTGNPQPDPGYIAAINQLYIAPKYPGFSPVGLYTPEQFWPITGLTSQTFGQSVNQGVPLLNNAVMTQTAAGNNVVVVGYSQSATVATLEMRHLDALPVAARPSPDQLSFVLLGNPNNPNGGILERFHGLYIPGLDVLFDGATPPNTPYPTTIYTIQYDGWADFPRYPINLVADANAIAGIYYLHGTYPDLTAAQLATAVQQPVSAGYTGATTYYMIPTENLPLLEPLRSLPVVGNPLADLIQPDLRVIVELGYDRTGYANIPTPAGLFPNINPLGVVDDLSHGALQGVHDGLLAGVVRPL